MRDRLQRKVEEPSIWSHDFQSNDRNNRKEKIMSRISRKPISNNHPIKKTNKVRTTLATAGLVVLTGCANMAWNDAHPKRRNMFARIMPDEIFTIPIADALGAGSNNGAAVGNPITAIFGFFIGVVEFPVCWVREMVTGESPSNRDLVRAIDRSANSRYAPISNTELK